MATAEEHLAQLLDAKDSEIEYLQDQIRELKEQVESMSRSLIWTRHEDFKDDSGLPCPRLEMVWEHNVPGLPSDYDWRVRYDLIYQHLLGTHVRVPFGQTLTSGLREGPIGRPTEAFPEGALDTPFREGAHLMHDAKQLRLPAYVRWKNIVQCLAPASSVEELEAALDKVRRERLDDNAASASEILRLKTALSRRAPPDSELDRNPLETEGSAIEEDPLDSEAVRSTESAYAEMCIAREAEGSDE